MLIVGGCSDVTVTHHVRLEYSQGDSLFVRKKALEGILERVVIKTVHIGEPFVSDLCSSATIERSIVYEDTLRGLWNADQLIGHAEAIALARAHLEELLADAVALHCA